MARISRSAIHPPASGPMMRGPNTMARPTGRDIGSRRHQAAPGQCTYCDAERRDRSSFHPPHDPSPHCRSGGRNHCTCDTCF